MRRKERTFFLDIEDYTLMIILWILTVFSVFVDIGGAVMIIAIICLLFERNMYVRNHASQILVVSSLCFLWDIIFSVVSGTFRFTLGWIPIVSFATNSTLWILNMVVSVCLLFFAVLGTVRAFQNEWVELPFLAPIAHGFEKSIKCLKK